MKIVTQPIFLAVILLAFIIVIGIIGYSFIFKWDLLDAVYMTIITIGTVGFHEVHHLDERGRIFTIFLIMGGIGVGSYAIANLSAFLIEGQIRDIFKGRKMEKKIARLKNHIIVCGYGKAGQETIDELIGMNKEYVIVEIDEHKVQELREQNQLAMYGDATEDMVLENAGVRCADGLIAALSNDADNVYVVLTAREMNPNLRIVARAIDKVSSSKLLRAGADKVVSPYSIAGRRMARLLLTPGLVDFLEVLVQSAELELKIEEIVLEKGTVLESKLLSQSNIKADTGGAYVIGIKKGHKKTIINPAGDTALNPGDVLYALGNNSQLQKLKSLAKPN
ncbi:MAG: potassium channel family protein [Candidatus Zhuqueibacterota bacterium]